MSAEITNVKTTYDITQNTTAVNNCHVSISYCQRNITLNAMLNLPKKHCVAPLIKVVMKIGISLGADISL